MKGSPKRFLVIGLGSMGKRRIRNLQALGIQDIIGFDLRQDRRAETQALYKIRTIEQIIQSTYDDFDSAIISTAPDKHNCYIRAMIDNKKPCFVELSLLVQDLPELSQLAKNNEVLVAPSCTFRFHPLVRSLKEIVQSGTYGQIRNFSYHTGQYLPDWHPWEQIKEFFVSNGETSGCKEILSLELHWLLDILGNPNVVYAFHQKTSTFDADIDDSYAVGMQFDGFAGVLLVDIVSRFATRSFLLNLQEAQIRWNWEEGALRLYDPSSKTWNIVQEMRGKAHAGYNPQLIEEMYISELQHFIDAAQGKMPFPHSLEEDIEILRVIDKIEAAGSGIPQ